MELRIKNWEGEERGRDRARKVARSKRGRGGGIRIEEERGLSV